MKEGTDIKQFRKTLAENVRTYRIKSKLTQEKLAEKAGITRPTMVKIESGSGDILYSSILRLCIALECEPDILCGNQSRQSENHMEHNLSSITVETALATIELELLKCEKHADRFIEMLFRLLTFYIKNKRIN